MEGALQVFSYEQRLKLGNRVNHLIAHLPQLMLLWQVASQVTQQRSSRKKIQEVSLVETQLLNCFYYFLGFFSFCKYSCVQSYMHMYIL